VLVPTALLLLLAQAPDLPVWTLDDALAAFLRSSPELDEARARERSSQADVTQAGLAPNPEASITVGNIPLQANVTGSGNGSGLSRNAVSSLALSRAFELGRKREKRVAAATSRVAATRASYDDAVRLARFELARAFWQALVAKEKRVLAEEIRARYAETARISRARFEAEDISAADLDKIVLEGSRQENEVADARTSEAVATQELLRLVGPGAPPAVAVAGELAAPPATPPDPAELSRRARDARPDVRGARQRVETARRDLALAEAQAVPDLTLGVSYTHSQATLAGDNPDTLAFTAGLPLPFSHRNQGEVAKARIELETAGRAVAAAEARADREIAEALSRLSAAEEKARRYDEGMLARARRALEVAEKAYRQGAASLLQLLEAERTSIQLRQDALDTLFELRTARLEVDRAAGAVAGAERTSP
jgi:cobalt-zinc-cadmium efflux system outer membrane protein